MVPFDNLEFAKGLMRDVELLFLLPEHTALVSGENGSGEQVCIP